VDDALHPLGTNHSGTGESDQKTVAVVMPGEVRPAQPPQVPPSPPTDRPPASELGHFEILEPLGRGGFGVVVKALDHKLSRPVAIKMMSGETAATSPARKRFVREARAAAAVRHENVVHIYAVEDGPVPYLVMEFVPGGSLQQYLDRTGPLEVREVLRLGAQIARGLAAAHATGLVHRDIKPANVLLEPGAHPRAKLTDFGIARAADDASTTQSGAVVGTPMYMAPEQAKGERVDHRADLFSLGSVLYTMVAGRPPFRAANSMAVLKRVTDQAPRPIPEICPETPVWLCDIIARLHEKHPDDRFQTAGEVAELLELCLTALERGAPIRRFGFARPRRLWRTAACAALLVCALGAVGFGARQLFPPTGAQVSSDVQPPAPEGTVPQPAHAGAPRPEDRRSDRYTNALDMEFVRVPAGQSVLGGGGGLAGDQPVTFSYDFYIGVYEVTQGEWEKVMGPGKNPSRFARTGERAAAVADVADEVLKRFPVDSVSWFECQQFVRELNERVKEEGWVYRLPRLLEWEYACRGGPDQSDADLTCDFYFARPSWTILPLQANYTATKLGRPCTVGSYPPNRLGIHDMHGNVAELCADVFAGDGGTHRPIRGGMWGDESEMCRAKNVNVCVASGHHVASGLRLVRVPVSAVPPKRAPSDPAAQLFEEVVEDLVRLNPLFRGKVQPTITDGRIVGLVIHDAGPVTDISPIRRLRHLESFTSMGGSFADLGPLKGLPLRELRTDNNWVLRDLSALRGMPLEELGIWGFQGDDLSPLQGMRLRLLNCGGGNAKFDLAPLRGMPLNFLCLNGSQVSDLSALEKMPLETLMVERTNVSDLSPLKGMKLKLLTVRETRVTDLSVVRGMPLEHLLLDFRPDRDTELVRSIPTLVRINHKPVDEFWKDVEKK
jgi:formylglycine-generating enzyme required for sulfatase activity